MFIYRESNEWKERKRIKIFSLLFQKVKNLIQKHMGYFSYNRIYRVLELHELSLSLHI